LTLYNYLVGYKGSIINQEKGTEMSIMIMKDINFLGVRFYMQKKSLGNIEPVCPIIMNIPQKLFSQQIQVCYYLCIYTLFNLVRYKELMQILK
jgi:hypothetical protein